MKITNFCGCVELFSTNIKIEVKSNNKLCDFTSYSSVKMTKAPRKYKIAVLQSPKKLRPAWYAGN